MTDLPDGGYSVVFTTLAADSIVVERSTTQELDDQVGTSVIHGRRPGRQLPRHHVARAVAPATPTTAALVIHNADNSDGTVTVSAIGASGPVPVPGLIDVVPPTAQRITST